MRIAVFTDNDFDKINGVTTTLRALLEHAPQDLHVRIYTADDFGVDEPHYLSLRAAGMGIPFYRGMKIHFPAPWAYLRQLRQDRIDLIHLTTPGPVGIAALYSASRLGIPLVGSFHTDLATYARLLSRSRWLGTAVEQYLRWPYGRCRQVLVPSQATASALDAAGIGHGNHVIWRRGVDTVLFNPSRRSTALRLRWGADAGTAVVMYLGRVSREKNLEAFITVHERLMQAGQQYRLVFVGDGPMREEIETRLPLAVVTGSIPHAQVGEYLASADVFAFPSRTDTAGNVVLEAQASGLPVVIGDEGGPRENVSPDRSALVTSASDTGAFADAVARLVRDLPLRQALAAGAREYAMTRDWPGALAPLFDTYRAALPDDATAPGLSLLPALPGDQRP